MTKIAQSEATKKLQLTKNRLIEAAKSTEIELYEKKVLIMFEKDYLDHFSIYSILFCFH